MKLAFVGPMHSGKTTVAKYYQGWEKHQFDVPRISFAKELKHLTMEFICDKLGIEVTEEDFKATDEGRKLFQLVGRIGRNYNEDYWVNTVREEAINAEHAVVDDLRFLNEATFLRSAGFTLIRVWRPFEERKRSVVQTIMQDNDCDLQAAITKFEQQANDPSELEQEGIICDHVIAASSDPYSSYGLLSENSFKLFEKLRETNGN